MRDPNEREIRFDFNRQFAEIFSSMNSSIPIKTVGRQRQLSPAEAVRCAQELQEFAESRSAFPRPRGFVLKFKTWEEHEHWRRSQANPRLW
ncbi:MAG: hypothetical protein HZA89_10605 [Verrucomicrobia bacterium]|nr:hypothetical protein [Verrucomicrobiota bacterium]